MDRAQIDRTDLTDWPLPEAFLAELGRIASTWTALEAKLDVCLGKLAGFDDLNDYRPFVLLKHSSFPQKLDAMSALCEQLLPADPMLVEYKHVLGQVRAAHAQRNQFMHSTLVLNPETQRVDLATGTARGSLKFSVQRVELTDLKRVSMEIYKAMLALHRLVTGRNIAPRWERKGRS